MKEKSTQEESGQREGEGLYHDIIQTSKDGFWLLNSEGNIIDVNTSYSVMSGYSKAELLEMNISQLEAKERGRETAEHIREIIETRREDYFESVHRRKDGSTFDVEISTTFPSSRNQFVVFIKDITERKRIESLLRESERLYRDLVEETNDLITRIDALGHLTFVNKMSDMFLGLSPDKCLGRPAFEFIHTDDREMTQKWFKDCVDKRLYQASIENRQVNSTTGKVFHMLWTSSFHYDDQGNLESVGSIARDFTERKYEQEKFATVFAYSPLLMTISSIEDGEYIDVNECFVTTTGYSREEAVGATSVALGLISQEDRDVLKKKLLKSGVVHDLELQLKKKSGEIFYCRYCGVVISIGGPERLLTIAQDITVQKQSEEEKNKFEHQIQQTQKMEALGTMAGGIAHDFNNLLTVILGNAELALYEIPENSPAKSSLDSILYAGDRAKNLVRQILGSLKRSVDSVSLHPGIKVHGYVIMMPIWAN